MATPCPLKKVPVPQQRVGVEISYQELLVQEPGRVIDRPGRVGDDHIEPPLDHSRTEQPRENHAETEQKKTDDGEPAPHAWRGWRELRPDAIRYAAKRARVPISANKRALPD